ncbi:MAG: VWA domain-containing protein [Lysobacter sp.]|nr:VWA domain-containing protein [Lysobacter sp.]
MSADAGAIGGLVASASSAVSSGVSSIASFFGLAGFAWPWWWLCLPLPLLVRWLLPAVGSRETALRVPYGARLEGLAVRRPAPVKHAGFGQMWLWFAWAALCIAASRPQQMGEVAQPPQSARDMMIALDLSGSMQQVDMELRGRAADRLSVAKAVIADFLDRRGGDRVGLIVFGERAYAMTPLTYDLETVREQLRITTIGLAGKETAIGDAIALGAKRLRQQPAEQRVLILLTDGVNTAGTFDPVSAANLARDVGVRVHTIAFGGYGAGMSVFGLPIRMPSADKMFDETTLKEVSRITGGRSYSARDVDQLVGIYAEINRLEPVKRPGERLRPKIERYPWPLAAALLFAAIAALVSARGWWLARRRR